MQAPLKGTGAANTLFELWTSGRGEVGQVAGKAAASGAKGFGVRSQLASRFKLLLPPLSPVPTTQLVVLRAGGLPGASQVGGVVVVGRPMKVLMKFAEQSDSPISPATTGKRSATGAASASQQSTFAHPVQL